MYPYRDRTAFNNFILGVILAALAVVSACRKEETTVSETPTSAPSEKPTIDTAPPDEQPVPPTSQPIGVDSEDAPNAPRALPTSQELRDWIKIEPVKIATGDKIDELITDTSQRAFLKTYRINLVARCAYAIKDLKGDVLFIETPTTADAFGIFSVMTSQPGQPNNVDGSIRAIDTSGGALTMFAWQGNTYVRTKFTGPGDDKSRQSCEYLFNRIIFNTPTMNAPLLVQIIPPQRADSSKMWLVRSLRALSGVKNMTLKNIDAAQMDTRLGLKGNQTLSIATVKVADDEPDNIIWMVQYDDPSAAAAAYQRYRQALEWPTNDLDKDSIVYSAKGKFLIGSWTAGQESIQHLLEDLTKALPQ
ncbi:MAG: hypothetical protein JSV03_04015 [Planctomycetota bacterium]|nr:MAG: hypothetical protein JSV03_04015 [Planctomycetota bacterium]